MPAIEDTSVAQAVVAELNDAGFQVPTDTQFNNFNSAFGWGNHSVQGYLTSGDVSGFALSSSLATVQSDLDAVEVSVGTLQTNLTSVTNGLSQEVTDRAAADTAHVQDLGLHAPRPVLADVGKPIGAVAADQLGYIDVVGSAPVGLEPVGWTTVFEFTGEPVVGKLSGKIGVTDRAEVISNYPSGALLVELYQGSQDRNVGGEYYIIDKLIENNWKKFTILTLGGAYITFTYDSDGDIDVQNFNSMGANTIIRISAQKGAADVRPTTPTYKANGETADTGRLNIHPAGTTLLPPALPTTFPSEYSTLERGQTAKLFVTNIAEDGWDEITV